MVLTKVGITRLGTEDSFACQGEDSNNGDVDFALDDDYDVVVVVVVVVVAAMTTTKSTTTMMVTIMKTEAIKK